MQKPKKIQKKPNTFSVLRNSCRRQGRVTQLYPVFNQQKFSIFKSIRNEIKILFLLFVFVSMKKLDHK